VSPVTSKTALVFDQSGNWRLPVDVCYPPKGEEEYDCIDVLRTLGFALVHPEIRRFKNLLVGKGFGVRLLTIGLLVKRSTSPYRPPKFAPNHRLTHS